MQLGKLWGLVLGGLVLSLSSAAKADAVFLQFAESPGDSTASLNYSGGVAGTVSINAGSSYTVNLQNGVTLPTGIGLSGLSASGTQLSGAKLVLGPGFTASGAATNSGGLLSQTLTGGNFRWETSTGQVLLTGTANAAQLAGPAGSGSGVGFLFSLNSVTYTGGQIVTSNAAYFAAAAPGSNGLSFSALGITPTLTFNAGNNSINGFNASVSGNFSAAPVPAPVYGGIALLAGLFVARRFWPAASVA